MTVQRAIEMLGIPTVCVTVEPEETRQARPPRALCPKPAEGSGAEFSVGRTFGRPNDAALHKAILKDALMILAVPSQPGLVASRSYA